MTTHIGGLKLVKEIKEYLEADKAIVEARKTKFESIKSLMLKGWTYTAIGQAVGVSEQCISAYYKKHSKI